MDESPCERQCGVQGVLTDQRIGCRLDRHIDLGSWRRMVAVMLRLRWIRLPTFTLNEMENRPDFGAACEDF